MGYRSDVKIEMEKNAFELMKHNLLEYKNDFPEEWGYFKPSVVKNDHGTRFCLSWTCVKWYEDFTDVGAVERVLKQLCKEHSEEKGWSFYFIRVGEDSGDVECRTNNSVFCPYIYPDTIIAGFDSGEDVEL